MALSDSQKDDAIENMIANVKVPKGVKDTPTMRVMVGLGINNTPKMVDDATLDNMAGKDLYRTVTDSKTLTSDAIVKEFTTAKYSSMSDSFGSSEGRGYYFAKQLNGAAQWGTNGGQVVASNQIMRAKVNPNAKILDVDKLLTGGKIRQQYVNDTNFHQKFSATVPPWDALSIWAIKKGYQGAKATDMGTGKSEMVIFDRGILSVSKTTKKLPSNYKQGDRLSWKKLN